LGEKPKTNANIVRLKTPRAMQATKINGTDYASKRWRGIKMLGAILLI
jgi:hypothetical protein